MLCKQCQEAITSANDDWEVERIKTGYSREVTIHEHRISLKSSAEAGCIICRQVWKQLLVGDRLSEHGNNSSKIQEDTKSPLGVWVKSTSYLSATKQLVVGISSKKHLDTTCFMVIPRSGDSDIAPKIVPNAHLSSTSETIELWRQWFYTCSASHAKCRTLSDRQMSVFKPKRLVKIIDDTDGNPQQWRLVLGADVQDLDYLTLSHCWGWTKHLSLTKHNYHALTATSPISTLPTTYRDALVVTAALGKQYIWIDSLCILQDDEEDWKSQSSVMGLIYKHSTCNIAAAWAENSSDGCFSPKEAPTTITLASDEFFVAEILYSAPFHQKDIWDAPLNQRSWVIQERYLAPRQLVFAKTQVYWACQELTASEEFPTGSEYLPDELMSGQASALQQVRPTSESNTAIRRIWADLVKSYSKCQLTFLTDKAIALAGLAAEIRASNDDTYLAGPWMKNLEDQLCWVLDPNEFPHQDHSTTPTYLAPTWSWINLNGPVEYDRAYVRESADTKLVEVLEASVESDDPNGLHSFVSSKLRLRGIAFWGSLQDPTPDQLGLDGYLVRPSAMFHLNKPLEYPGQYSITKPTITIEWDEYQMSLPKDSQRYQELLQQRTGQLLVLLVGVNKGAHTRGLLLRQLKSAKDEVVCVRLGVVDIWGYDFAEYIWEKLGLPKWFAGVDRIDLNDPRLNGLLQEVTIQ
ncbi:hypothetical protein ACHAPO_009808 [Fusarium lateritium]